MSDNDYRLADTLIGCLLGGFAGFVTTVYVVLSGYSDVGLLVLILVIGIAVGGGCSWLLGKRFTQRFEDFIRRMMGR